MTDTEVINIKVPATLFEEIEKFTRGRYLSKGEFVRSAIVRFLSSLGLFKPFSVRMKGIREEMQMRMEKIETGKKFSPEKEIEEIRRIRKDLWSRNR